MIEEFFQFLSRLNALKKAQRWQDAALSIQERSKQELGLDFTEVLNLTETELFARMIQSEPGYAAREKALMLATMLKESGDLTLAQGRTDESGAFYLKGLNLLLSLLARDEAAEYPEFVPKVDVFLTALEGTELPLSSNAALMGYFERTGQFGRAEDALFRMLESDVTSRRLLEFGMTFYRRLALCNDRQLEEGGLPRLELEAGLAEWMSRYSNSK